MEQPMQQTVKVQHGCGCTGGLFNLILCLIAFALLLKVCGS